MMQSSLPHPYLTLMDCHEQSYRVSMYSNWGILYYIWVNGDIGLYTTEDQTGLIIVKILYVRQKYISVILYVFYLTTVTFVFLRFREWLKEQEMAWVDRRAFSFISNCITACAPWEALSPVCVILCTDVCVCVPLLHIAAISRILVAVEFISWYWIKARCV